MDTVNRVDARTNPQKFDVGFGLSLFYSSSYRPAVDKPSAPRPQEKNPSPQPRTYATTASVTAPRTTTTQPATPKQTSAPPATTTAVPTSRSSLPRPAVGIPTTYKDGTVPMELDASRRNGLTPEERQRRFDNHLCLYCGSPDHVYASCPLKLARPWRRVNATQGTPVFL
jgi:hypothetical protein